MSNPSDNIRTIRHDLSPYLFNFLGHFIYDSLVIRESKRDCYLPIISICQPLKSNIDNQTTQQMLNLALQNQIYQIFFVYLEKRK